MPWVANLATVVVVLSAAWWSNSQRPVVAAGEASIGRPAAVPARAMQPATPTGNTGDAAVWSAPAAAPAPAPVSDGLRTVSFGGVRR